MVEDLKGSFDSYLWICLAFRYNNGLSSNSSTVHFRSDNSGTVPDDPVHLATMLSGKGSGYARLVSEPMVM